MAMPISQALTVELDAYTPCGQGVQRSFCENNFLRIHYLLCRLLEISGRHFTSRQQEKIVEALRFSAKRHAGVYRKDNVTPYFMHLLEVVYILFQMRVFDFKITISAILHDVVEDTSTGLKEISLLFGSAVKNIVDLMTKHPNLGRKSRYWVNMKKEADLNCRWRVIVLKFADRIHNLMTLYVLSIEKIKEKIAETIQEFPGLYKILASTILKLYKKGTIKKKEYLSLPFRLNNRLIYEMGHYI